jgi:Mrp family chromosome partitioning ATPase
MLDFCTILCKVSAYSWNIFSFKEPLTPFLKGAFEQVSGVVRSNPEQADTYITQALAGWKEQLRQAALANTSFTGLTIAVTTDEDKVMQLFASKAFEKILKALANEVDCILVNAPTAETGDATLMSVAQTVDGVLVYVSPKSKRPLLKLMLTDFEKLQCPVLGLLSRC